MGSVYARIHQQICKICTLRILENSSTGCMSIHREICKILSYCSILFYFETVRSIVNQRKNNNIFTGLNFSLKALNFRF